MTTIIAIDPGQMTGVFTGGYTATQPLKRTGYFQIPGGAEGFANWLTSKFEVGYSWDVIVSEKFSTRPMSRQYRLEELEPIRIEGLLGWVFLDVVWQPPSAMVLRQGATQAERKRRSDDVLRNGGLWLTGKDVDYKDANDVNAAAKHALAYMRGIGHVPTISAYLQQ